MLLKGQIDAPVIRVDGWVEGNLTATNLVAVMDKAKIKGNIITPAGGLEMKIGSEFVGKFITNTTD